MTTRLKLLALIGALLVTGNLAGCAGAVVGGAATGAAVVHDRRSAGTVLDDQVIELEAIENLNANRELLEKAHISITIVYDLFSRRVRAAMSAFACLIGLGGFSFISWQTFVLAKRYFLAPRMDETDTLGLPYSPFILLLSIGAGMMALMLIVDVVRYIAEVTRK